MSPDIGRAWPGQRLQERLLRMLVPFRMFPYGKALNMATCWGMPFGFEVNSRVRFNSALRAANGKDVQYLYGQRKRYPGTYLRQRRIDEAREDHHDRQWIHGKSGGVLAVWIWVCLSNPCSVCPAKPLSRSLIWKPPPHYGNERSRMIKGALAERLCR